MSNLSGHNAPQEPMEELLDRALLLPKHEREEFAARMCPDATHRTRLLKLLAAADRTDGFLDKPPLRSAEAALEATVLCAAGQTIGPYRLTEYLGRGGMGEVWLAERAQREFDQKVALKVMLPGTATAHDRFKVERQILAQLDHPGIARLLDGGLTQQGWPWMAMEYVQGHALLEWCETHGSDLAERLALFLQVCDAVAYAHSHLVVHRDLKPTNILVTDARRVKLLDFGIAKLLAPEATGEVTQTTYLSPAYAAPEQLEGAAITTATDVFALGVILYRLLSGSLPWPVERAPLGAALMRVLADTTPTPPSRVANSPIPSDLLRGDLDAIAAKALRPDAITRYVDARALAEDVRRHLKREPVHARAGARTYVARRFVRRHLPSFAFTAAIVVALAAGLAGVAWQAQRAEREAARAIAAKQFLIDMFKASDPRIAQDRPRGQITARELLDASVEKIDRQFADDTETQIELMGVAAQIYRELEDEERYERLHNQYLNRARHHYSEGHPIVIAALLEGAMRTKDRYEHEEALHQLDAIDSLIHRAKLDRSALRASWWLVRGQALMNDSARAEEQTTALRNAADLYAAVAPKDPQRVTALADLGTSYSNRMEFQPARRYLEEAVKISAVVENRNDAELATINGNLGQIAQSMGDFEAADQAYARAEEIMRRTYGASNHRHWVPSAVRARTAHLGGNRDRALTLFDTLLSDIPADSTHHDAIEAREWFGACLAAEGRSDQAIPLLEAAERFYRSTTMYDYQLPRVRATLGDAYENVGRIEDARRTLKSALDHRVAHDPAHFQPVLAIRERWGRFLLARGDIDAAKRQFDEVMRRANGRNLSHIALAQAGLARVALARGDTRAALAASTRSVEMFDAVTGFRDVRMGPTIWLVHSQALLAIDARKEARDWALKSLEARQRYDHPQAASIQKAEMLVAATER